MADENEDGFKFEPMPGKIVVQAVGESEFLVNKGKAIIFANPAGQRPRTTGIVIAVPEPWRQGEDEPELVTFLQVGDKVIFGAHSGVDVQLGRKKFIILREIEILTKVVGEGDIQEVGVAPGQHDDVE